MISSEQFYETMKKELAELKESAIFGVDKFESENPSIPTSLKQTEYYKNYLRNKNDLQIINTIEKIMRNGYRSGMSLKELNSFYDIEYREKYGPNDEDVFNGILKEFGRK